MENQYYNWPDQDGQKYEHYETARRVRGWVRSGQGSGRAGRRRGFVPSSVPLRRIGTDRRHHRAMRPRSWRARPRF